jgi:hypothetical protein
LEEETKMSTLEEEIAQLALQYKHVGKYLKKVSDVMEFSELRLELQSLQ